jgi:hypothetical protein
MVIFCSRPVPYLADTLTMPLRRYRMSPRPEECRVERWNTIENKAPQERFFANSRSLQHIDLDAWLVIAAVEKTSPFSWDCGVAPIRRKTHPRSRYPGREV